MVEIEYHLIWSRTAQKDLKAIALYYRKEVSLKVAQKIVESIRSEARRLINMPFMGQIEPSFVDNPTGYRYLVSGNYKIIYYVKNDKIRINNIFDCRQDPDKLKQAIR